MQPIGYCRTTADTKPTISHALECCESPAERHRQQTTQGGPVSTQDWTAVFPQDYFQSAAPDLSLLLTQDNTRSTSIENTPRTDFASVEWTDHPRPIAIAFFDDNTPASRIEYDVQAALHRASHPYDRSDGGCMQPGSWQ